MDKSSTVTSSAGSAIPARMPAWEVTGQAGRLCARRDVVEQGLSALTQRGGEPHALTRAMAGREFREPAGP